ncbi:membrane lipoprotein lipid attachment site-containing protein [Bacillus sp. RG28]|uniref:Membrane lipoprotein lipid attachment site-containing protein n=1 Tax=Gottfriedia endophytica TaxID=2820819 RepID=A0A940NK19_9BACI|nr:membrane lipoprotein lipid attachment site-containing protein [Gottfriedia endophytica]MBP0725875.1 membrane lipoprotein lipid attachment site-containing protein [Gottfriedia endophytica]
MKKFIYFILIVVFLSGCTSNTDKKSVEGPKFLQKLKAVGYTINKTEDGKKYTPHTFLSVYPTYYNIDDKRLAIYEYKNENDARKDIKTISEDGSKIGKTIVEWIDFPHFYQKEDIIVSYIGSDKKLERDLEKILGKSITNNP